VTVDTSGRQVSTVPLEGGHVALDFLNTVGGLRSEPPSPADELLLSYEDVTIWSARLGLISERDAGSLRAAARRDEKAAKRALGRAIELRELLDGIFRALADGKEPPAELLDRLRDAERAALAEAHLACPPGGAGSRGRAAGDQALEWTWPRPRELTDPLRPIVHAAVELLTDGPLDRLKVCGNCRWLFLDESRNHSRRWCSMDECGIQMKHARFVEQRRRRARAGTS
jgi:predicted RNA-binding Zn ribbon-like protein